MSKYTRKQRKEPEDQFISFWQRLFNKVEPYARAIAISLGTALVLVIAVWGISQYLEHRAEQATEAFGRAVDIYEAELYTGDTPPKPEPEDNPIPRFKTAKERADATLAELEGFDKRYGSSSMAHDAVLFRAGVLYDQSRFDDAIAAYQKYLGDKSPPAYTAIAREGLGLSYEATGKLDQALQEYQKLEPKQGEFYRDRALWDQARIYKKKGDKQKAVSLYKDILSKTPTSPLRQDVDSQLAMLEGTAAPDKAK
jgi:tetratricopeptide (TPR) repeat protein